MKKIVIPIIIILASVIMIIVNVFISEEIDKGFWFRSLSSLLLIVAMIITIISKLNENKAD